MEEIWKPIIWFEWSYEVSNLGKIKSFNYHQEWYSKNLLLHRWRSWHSRVYLCKYWICKKYTVSRLVAIAFIPNPKNLPCVCHKDETLDENWLLYNWSDNLFWGTHKDNVQDCHRKWRANNHFKTNNPSKWKFWEYSILAKKVNQYDLDWNFIKQWNCIIDASKNTNSNYVNISHCCKLKRKTCWWFIWKYARLSNIRLDIEEALNSEMPDFILNN